MRTPADTPKTFKSLRIGVLVGSVRLGSNTSKAAAAFAAEVASAGASVDLVDPREIGLVVPGLAGGAAMEGPLQAALRGRVSSCDAVALVTPEYDGSYSAITKILVECLGYPSILAGKPVTAIGVASGRIGAVRALDHLRGVLFNIGALVLPTSPSIAQVHHCFDAQGLCVATDVALQLKSAAHELVSYAAAFRAT